MSKFKKKSMEGFDLIQTNVDTNIGHGVNSCSAFTKSSRKLLAFGGMPKYNIITNMWLIKLVYRMN